MQVRQLIDRKHDELITVNRRERVTRAARLLMKHRIGGLAVIEDDGRLVGFVAERELVRAFDHDPDTLSHITVEEIMQRPAPVCPGDASLYDVMARMTRERLRHMVVTEDGRPVGVVSVGDLVKHRLEELETETGVLRDYLAARRAVT
jgi:CBS domain-containing protein